MRSSLFYRLLKDSTSTDTKRSKFIKKLRSFQTRTVLVTKLRLSVDFDHVKEYFSKREFEGVVENITFHHTKRNDYTKCVIVKMTTYDAVKKILATDSHEINGDRVCVEPHRGSTQIKKPPFIKGPYKLTLSGLDTNMGDAVLNRSIEDAFADLGHHTAIDLWKDLDSKKLAGQAEIRFVNKEDGLLAVDIAREKHWDAQLLGPRDMDHEN